MRAFFLTYGWERKKPLACVRTARLQGWERSFWLPRCTSERGRRFVVQFAWNGQRNTPPAGLHYSLRLAGGCDTHIQYSCSRVHVCSVVPGIFFLFSSVCFFIFFVVGPPRCRSPRLPINRNSTYCPNKSTHLEGAREKELHTES